MKHKPTESILIELHDLISSKNNFEVEEYEKRLKLLLQKVDNQLINDKKDNVNIDLEKYLKLIR